VILSRTDSSCMDRGRFTRPSQNAESSRSLALSGDPAGCCAVTPPGCPLADGCAEVSLAPHMLYHVPDRLAAIIELRRVTRAGGPVLASWASSRPDHSSSRPWQRSPARDGR